MDSAANPGSRYVLGNILGQGVFGKVFNATDTQESNKKVAIKVQKYHEENKSYIEEEYAILKELSSSVYIVGFYGHFKKDDNVWFVLENCEGNTALDLVTGLLQRNRRMSEEHMGYILKELVKAIIYLHENCIIHRDIKASNILLTSKGEVKLCDFGLAKKMQNREDTLNERVGSPGWMAPEVATANNTNQDRSAEAENQGYYDNRVDVWSVGITAIELSEGKSPFQNMHPSRALFQIVKNPPPKLLKVSNWTENFHDFISECLVKYFEHRPYIMEVIDHPFLQEIPENNYHLSLEIQSFIDEISKQRQREAVPETIVIGKYLKRAIEGPFEKIVEEDLADLDVINEKNVIQLLEKRFKNEQYYTFVGDILLAINPNCNLDIYGTKYHQKYFQKFRSDNAPHIYAVADTAYQNALHHKVPQQIVLTGESASGKTKNYLHIIDHLFYIGEQHPVSIYRIKNGIKLIHAMTNASTPTNSYSTRCVLKTNLSFGQTGKLTAASFKVQCLEKWRVSAVDMDQCNFHILYYIYDGLVRTDALKKYKLNSNRNYRYLRLVDGEEDATKPRDNIEQNVIKYKKIFSYLEEFEFSEEQITTFFSIIAAILNLGEVRFQENEDNECAIIENKEHVDNFADLMEIDYKKFSWALTNYCLVKRGNVTQKKNTCDEARDTRDVLANNLYCRFVDYVVGLINNKLEIGKAIFGDKYSIKLLDFFGFECFKQNHLPQFFVNALNEQLQYHFLQRIFAWEMQDMQSEELEYQSVSYFDNRNTLNQLLSKPDGLLCVVDDASKRNLGGGYIMETLQNHETNRVMVTKNREFSVAHYTGVVSYNAKEMANKNRDFLAPEIVETLRESENPIIRMLFVSKLERTGGLILNLDRTRRKRTGVGNNKMIAGINQFSQTKNMRTAGTVFRCLCLELLKELSIGGSSGGTHFVRCIRSDLKGKPQNFNSELIRQQVKALTVIETARVRQKGFPQRISFSEFLRRYQFLAFDFDENVDITKENCRLLLIRLKMEGWAIGKSRVFLKYYNEEYLSRLYETQVRQIVKIQSIMRGFLIKCRLNKEKKQQEKRCIDEIQKRRRSSVESMSEDQAAEIIQKAYRKNIRKKGGVSDEYEPLDPKDRKLIWPYAKKWKSPSIFHVLMQYRAAKIYDFFNFSQQVHLYNQNAFFHTQKTLSLIDLDTIDRKAQVHVWIGEIKPVVLKLRFRLDEIPFYDTSALVDALTNVGTGVGEECWDSPYRWRYYQTEMKDLIEQKCSDKTELHSIPYNRDPEEPLAVLPNSTSEEKFNKNEKNKMHRSSDKLSNKSLRFEQGEPETFHSVHVKKTDCNYRYNQTESTYNSSPANKDFDFIKSNHLSPRPRNADPVAELRTIGQRRESASEDEPPFNFQGMLRKTNFQRESLKKALDNRRGSLKNTLDAVRRFSLTKDREDQREKAMVVNSRPVYMELVPGLVLEGVEVDL